MDHGLSLTTAAASEPLTVAQLKAWLRVDHTADDDLIESLGKAARDLTEKLLDRQLVSATWTLYLEAFPGGRYECGLFLDDWTIRLPKAPLQSVTWVKYYDTDNVLQTLAASNYDVVATRDPAQIRLSATGAWPAVYWRPDAVEIKYICGYGAAAAVPETLRTAIKVATACWYEHRGDDLDLTELPPSALALLISEWSGIYA